MTNEKNSAGRRGFIFTIDATLALFLLVLTLVSVTFLASQAEDSPYASLHIVRSAKDVLIVLEKQGTLAAGNSLKLIVKDYKRYDKDRT